MVSEVKPHYQQPCFNIFTCKNIYLITLLFLLLLQKYIVNYFIYFLMSQVNDYLLNFYLNIYICFCYDLKELLEK